MSEFLIPDERIVQLRQKWRFRGQVRPDFAIDPNGHEESVWDYPRPPALHHDRRRISVRTGNQVLAETNCAIRVLETASPPTFYIRPEDVRLNALEKSGDTSVCEWKGVASDLILAGTKNSVGWTYSRVFEEFAAIEGWYSFYPGRVECFLDDERVRAQPGHYYGGWVTDEIVGPFKGGPQYVGY